MSLNGVTCSDNHFSTKHDAREGHAKADAASRRLSQINGSIELVPEVVDVTADNIGRLLDALRFSDRRIR